MADKLLIALVTIDPGNGNALLAPLSQATVAAAMEYEVEVIMSGVAGRLAVQGVASALEVQGEGQCSVYDLIKEAYAAGVRFKVCTPGIELWGNDLIPEIDETVGGAYLISEAMDDDTVTFSY